MGQLKNSSEKWKTRVEPSDATQFTVAGKMKTPVKLQFQKSDVKQTPPMNIIKSSQKLGLTKSPSMIVPSMMGQSQEKLLSSLKRSFSLRNTDENLENGSNIINNNNNNNNTVNENDIVEGSRVTVPKLDDDDTFNDFFTSLQKTVIHEEFEISDFDDIISNERLSIKKIVQRPRARRGSKNPLRALAERNDLQNEYTEIKTGIAEKELRRLKLEQCE